jgi:hypothetical protein
LFVTVYAAITLATLHSHRNYYFACATMKKQSSSLAVILAVAALTSGVMLATTNSAHTCVLGKGKGTRLGVSGNSPTQASAQVKPDDTSNNKLGIIGGGLAAIASLLVVGVAYKARRAGQEADKFLAELPQDGPWETTSWSIPIPPEELCESISEQEASDSSKPEKDLTLVG